MIAAVEAGEKKDVALHFGVPASTLSTILEQKYHIKTLTHYYLSRIRQKKCEYPDLEECLMAWFTQCRQNNITISGPILKEKSISCLLPTKVSQIFKLVRVGWKNLKNVMI